MNTVIRGFRRDPRSRIGFQSANRASTDAISALENWKLQVADREYQVHQDTDDELVACWPFRLRAFHAIRSLLVTATTTQQVA